MAHRDAREPSQLEIRGALLTPQRFRCFLAGLERYLEHDTPLGFLIVLIDGYCDPSGCWIEAGSHVSVVAAGDARCVVEFRADSDLVGALRVPVPPEAVIALMLSRPSLYGNLAVSLEETSVFFERLTRRPSQPATVLAPPEGPVSSVRPTRPVGSGEHHDIATR